MTKYAPLPQRYVAPKMLTRAVLTVGVAVPFGCLLLINNSQVGNIYALYMLYVVAYTMVGFSICAFADEVCFRFKVVDPANPDDLEAIKLVTASD